MNNKKIKVSIIVPVYNIEKYINKCLQTLVKQSLKEIEIIVVDDGSTDDSAKVIEKIQSDKIKFIKKENTGVAQTRNLALKQAKGEYIGFVDGDDYVDFTMYEKLYEKAKNENSDIVCCEYNRIYSTKRIRCKVGEQKQYDKSLYENPEILNCGVPYIWNKIFKRTLIEENNFEFEDYAIFEDLLFTYKCFLKANKISLVDEPLYYYIKTRSSSVMSSFSKKLFDIFDVMNSLNNYYKENAEYDRFKEALLAVALNHIYIRLNAKVKFKELGIKYIFLKKTFRYLDREFPGWKNHEYYFIIKNKPREKYTSKWYWMRNLLTGDITETLKYAMTLIKKSVKRDNMEAKYLKYIKEKNIDEKAILIDSQHGENISGNMFYILREIYTNKRYKDYKIFVTVTKDKKDKIKEKLDFYGYSDLELIDLKSKKYLKVLATAKYLFNDTSFMPYFIKKKEQVYLNTWHGTPLKTLGRNVKQEYFNIGNLQKNFSVADYLLYPSEYMMKHMLEDYMISNISNNKIMLTGYPRNTIFFEDENRKKIKVVEKLEEKEIIAYMPTWRGVLSKVENLEIFYDEIFQEIDKKLKENQILYVNFHPYLSEKISFEKYERIRKFPNNYETYDFLNICDILITDYSSVFFDYAVTKKKIILYTYDEKEYFKERGVYIELDELPFPKVDNVQDLLREINSPINYDITDFIQKFCKYDNKDVAKKICSHIILNKKENLNIIPMPNNKKKNVLLFAGGLKNNEITEEFFKYISTLDLESANYYLTFRTRKIAKNKEILLELPKNMNYIGQLGPKNTTKFEKLMLLLLNSDVKLNRVFSKRYKRIFDNEIKRIFGDIKFDSVVVFGIKSRIDLNLFANIENAKKIYINEKERISKKRFSDLQSKYDKILIYDTYNEAELEEYNQEEKYL